MPSSMCALHRRGRSPRKPKEAFFVQPIASHMGFYTSTYDMNTATGSSSCILSDLCP
jgi:hypothetical protein